MLKWDHRTSAAFVDSALDDCPQNVAATLLFDLMMTEPEAMFWVLFGGWCWWRQEGACPGIHDASQLDGWMIVGGGWDPNREKLVSNNRMFFLIRQVFCCNLIVSQNWQQAGVPAQTLANLKKIAVMVEPCCSFEDSFWHWHVAKLLRSPETDVSFVLLQIQTNVASAFVVAPHFCMFLPVCCHHVHTSHHLRFCSNS